MQINRHFEVRMPENNAMKESQLSNVGEQHRYYIFKWGLAIRRGAAYATPLRLL